MSPGLRGTITQGLALGTAITGMQVLTPRSSSMSRKWVTRSSSGRRIWGRRRPGALVLSFCLLWPGTHMAFCPLGHKTQRVKRYYRPSCHV